MKKNENRKILSGSKEEEKNLDQVPLSLVHYRNCHRLD